MKIVRIGIDLESIEKCKSELKNSDIKKLIENFYLGYDNILSIYAFPIVLMSYGYEEIYEFEYRIKAATKLKTKLTDKSQSMIDEIAKMREADKKKSRGIDQAMKQLKHVTKQYAFLEKSINTISLNSVVNSWTIFESIMKDLWIYILNTNPNKYLKNVLNGNLDSVDGIEGKNISVNLLFKYNLDISKNLGDILHKKYDFTGVSGIKKAYSEIFKNQKLDFSFLDDEYLNQLEISRHLIVHKGGVIDEDYLKRTTFKREIKGKVIDYSARRTEKIINSAVEAGIKIFEIVDKNI
jgi:hypothetical protein